MSLEWGFWRTIAEASYRTTSKPRKNVEEHQSDLRKYERAGSNKKAGKAYNNPVLAPVWDIELIHVASPTLTFIWDIELIHVAPPTLTFIRG